MSNPSWLTPEVEEALKRRPAARAQFDPSIVSVKELPPEWSGGYDPISDKVVVPPDLTQKEAPLTIPHEFEHRAQNHYGTSSLLSDKETAVRLGDRRWNAIPAEAVPNLTGSSGFNRRALAEADLERLIMEDRGLRDLAARDDDYFYDEFGRQIKANVGAQSLVQGAIHPDLQAQRRLFKRSQDAGSWDDVPVGGQSLIQSRLYNQPKPRSALTEKILRPRTKYDKALDYISRLLK